jgi:hypothetical protein
MHFAIELLPVRHRFQLGIHRADRLAAQLEQVRVKEGEVVIGDRSAAHRFTSALFSDQLPAA